jgi:hypothetical protein
LNEYEETVETVVGTVGMELDVEVAVDELDDSEDEARDEVMKKIELELDVNDDLRLVIAEPAIVDELEKSSTLEVEGSELEVDRGAVEIVIKKRLEVEALYLTEFEANELILDELRLDEVKSLDHDPGEYVELRAKETSDGVGEKGSDKFERVVGIVNDDTELARPEVDVIGSPEEDDDELEIDRLYICN